MATQPIDFKKIWESADAFETFLQGVKANEGLWESVFRRATVPQWALDKLTDRGEALRILIITEDWCGDACNTVPVVAKLGAEVDAVNVRILKRDENPEVMDRYLTHGARSIPIVILLDADFNEIGHWGPRPSELQQWVMENKDTIPKEERYPLVRRWYAKDKGESTLREVLGML